MFQSLGWLCRTVCSTRTGLPSRVATDLARQTLPPCQPSTAMADFGRSVRDVCVPVSVRPICRGRLASSAGPSARPCDRSTTLRLVSGRSPEPLTSAAIARRPCFGNSVAHVTSGRVRRDPRSLGLAPARLAGPPGGFIRDPRRDASSRNTASLPRAGLAANPPNRPVAPCSARHSASRPAPQEFFFSLFRYFAVFCPKPS